jgi:histone H3/H4
MGAVKVGVTKKRSRKSGNLGLYVSRINTSVGTKAVLSDATRRALSTYALDLFERIADSAALMAKRDKVETIKTRHVQGAVALVYSGELRRNALSEAARACAKYAQKA